MRTRISDKQLPRDWSGFPGVVLDCDIKPWGGTRLRCKLLVFGSRKAMRTWWDQLFEEKLGGRTLGAVRMLAYSRGDTMFVDPRYVCVIALCKGHLTMEVVAHEAVHAAFAWAKRKRGDAWCPVRDFDEETICYPTGTIASNIAWEISRAKLC